jgi:hypothetical protein
MLVLQAPNIQDHYYPIIGPRAHDIAPSDKTPGPRGTLAISTIRSQTTLWM